MRHNKKFNHLGRTASHRASLLANMATSLIMHKRITTTLAKAKALKKYVEPLITRSKSDTTTSRRVVFIELVDFDENMAKTAKAEKKTRRSRRSTKKADAATETAAEAPAKAEATEAPAAETPAEEAPKAE